MKYKTINSDKFNTPYSDAIEIGDIVEFSGMLGNTEYGLVDGGFESELHQIFQNLRDGKYLIIAMKDVGDNYFFDPFYDKIGFIDSLITLPKDSIIDFKLFILGEGIEVEEKSFSEEVASQVNNTT